MILAALIVLAFGLIVSTLAYRVMEVINRWPKP